MRVDYNLYQFCGNQPSHAFDPFGEWFLVDDIITGPIDEIAAGIAITGYLAKLAKDAREAAETESRTEAKRRRCQEMYDKYKDAQDSYGKNPASNAKTCGELLKALNLLEAEVQGRKDYMNSGCDEFDWNKRGTKPKDRKEKHSEALAQKQKALDRLWETYKAKCLCPDTGTPRPPSTPL